MSQYDKNKKPNELVEALELVGADEFIVQKDGEAFVSKVKRENTGLLTSSDIANFETTTELNARDVANRARANHTGTQLASTISDFDTTVEANTEVSANTSARHTHANKALLDTYTQTEVNLALAVAHKDLTNNPHTVTKDQVGLSNVDNIQQIPLTEKSANNGVATLDAGGKVPATQLPNTIMSYEGIWNANTNTPTLADATVPTHGAGTVYLVTVAGTQDLGSGSQTFAIGDWVVYNGTIWEKSINSNAVVSVNGQQGVVDLDAGDVGAEVPLTFSTGLTRTTNTITTNDGEINHNQLQNYNVAQHRIINDGSPSTTTLYSGTKINNELNDKANSSSLTSHIGDKTNPHEVSLEQARTKSNSLSGDINYNSNKGINVATPVNGGDIANKDYADGIALGIEWKEAVIAIENTPPGSPTTGDRYIVGVGTGAWDTEDNNIAEWNGSSWDFTVAVTNFAVWVTDEDVLRVYNGTAWVKFGSTSTHNNLTGIQGGSASERYHLSEASFDKTNAFLDDGIFTEVLDEIDFKDSGILGNGIKHELAQSSSDIIVVSGADNAGANGTYVKVSANQYTHTTDANYSIWGGVYYTYYGYDWEIRSIYYFGSLYGINGTDPIGTWTAVGYYTSGSPTSIAGTSYQDFVLEHGNLVIEGTDIHPKNGQGEDFDGEGVNFMWLSDKKALRAGQGQNNRWNKNNIGEYSVGFGDNNLISGDYSIAQGENLQITGNYSFQLGRTGTANGNYGFSVGAGHNLNSNNNTAFGNSCTLTGGGAFAFGNICTVNGAFSGAFGSISQSLGNYSYAFGDRARCFADFCLAIGRNINVNEIGSQAFGSNLEVDSAGTTVFGANMIVNSPNSVVFGYGNQDLKVSEEKGIENLGRVANYTLVNEENLEDNIISNTNFSDGTDWTFGTGWALGTNEATKQVNGLGYLEYTGSFPIEVGKVYEVEFEITSWTSGDVFFEVAGYTSDNMRTLGTFKRYFTAINDTDKIKFRTAASGARLNISNITVKECSGGSLTISNRLTVNKRLILPVKDTTGHIADPVDGLMYVNTEDNKVSVYADGAWRDLTTW